MFQKCFQNVSKQLMFFFVRFEGVSHAGEKTSFQNQFISGIRREYTHSGNYSSCSMVHQSRDNVSVTIRDFNAMHYYDYFLEFSFKAFVADP